MEELESNPVVYNWGELGNAMEEVREKVARFIGTDKANIILTRNTTEGINLVGSCLDLKPGDEILITNNEHGGGECGLIYLAKRTGANIKKIEMPLPVQDKEQLIDLIRSNITSKTKVLLLSHVTTLTGLRMPWKEITEFTRSRGILSIADGAQAPGMLKVDVQYLGIDIYASSGHKWLLGPKETGFLYLRPAIQERIKPVFTQKWLRRLFGLVGYQKCSYHHRSRCSDRLATTHRQTEDRTTMLCPRASLPQPAGRTQRVSDNQPIRIGTGNGDGQHTLARCSQPGSLYENAGKELYH